MYLRFTPFKSKEFISLVSARQQSILTETNIGLLQTKMTVTSMYGDYEEEYTINNRLHSINDEPVILYEHDSVSEWWYRNHKVHRTRRFYRGKKFTKIRPLPAIIYNNKGDFYRNDKLYSPSFDIVLLNSDNEFIAVKRFSPSCTYENDYKYHLDGREIKQEIKVKHNVKELYSIEFMEKVMNEHKNYPRLSQGEMMELILKRDYDIVFTPEYIN